ncbi:hypothetical protein U1Q18_039473, partial [Sarracenia purpurea var. burkii]
AYQFLVSLNPGGLGYYPVSWRYVLSIIVRPKSLWWHTKTSLCIVLCGLVDCPVLWETLWANLNVLYICSCCCNFLSPEYASPLISCPDYPVPWETHWLCHEHCFICRLFFHGASCIATSLLSKVVDCPTYRSSECISVRTINVLILYASLVWFGVGFSWLVRLFRFQLQKHQCSVNPCSVKLCISDMKLISSCCQMIWVRMCSKSGLLKLIWLLKVGLHKFVFGFAPSFGLLKWLSSFGIRSQALDC